MANTDGKRRPRRKRKTDEHRLDPGTALEELKGTVVRLEGLSQAVVRSIEFVMLLDEDPLV